MKRTILWLLVVVLSISLISMFSLTGCKEEVAEEEAAEEEVAEEEAAEEEVAEEVVAEEVVTITYASLRTEDAERMNMINQVFMDQHPNIIVEFQPMKNTEYDAAMATGFESGTWADIMYLRSFDASKVLYDEGWLQELNDLIPALADFDDTALNAWRTEDGIIYGLPNGGLTHGVIYNTEIWGKYNLEEPKTWDEFLNSCQVLKDNGETVFAQGLGEPWQLYEVMFSGLGPNFYGGEASRQKLMAGEMKLTDKPWVDAFAACLQLKPFFPNGYEGIDYVDMQQLFGTGQAATYIGASVEIGPFYDIGLDTLGWFAPPVVHEGDTLQYSFHVDSAIGMNKATEHPEEVIEYLNWCTTQEYALEFMDDLPGWFSYVPGEYELADPVASDALACAKGAVLTIRPLWEKLSSQDPSGNLLMWDAMTKMFLGEFTPYEAAEYVQTQLETWYEPFQK